MEITLALQKDLREIYHLFEAAKRQMDQTNVHQWTIHYPNKEIVEADIANQQLYKLVVNKKIVAVATLSFESQESYTLRRIATNPDYLSKGYASVLINDLINRIREKNGKHIYSSTNHSNEKMQHFFKKIGFEKISEYAESEREHLGSFYKYLKEI